MQQIRTPKAITQLKMPISYNNKNQQITQNDEARMCRGDRTNVINDYLYIQSNQPQAEKQFRNGIFI